MYSVVLMAAMTASSAEAPAFHKQRSWGGCYGGLYLHSGCYGSCMGGGCWGAYWGGGASAYGCNGGWGSCYGAHGGWGSGAGYHGGCYGCMGCYGSWSGYGDHVVPAPIAYPSYNPMTQPAGTGPTAPPPARGTDTGVPGVGTPGTGTPGTGTPATPGTGTPATPGTGTPPIPGTGTPPAGTPGTGTPGTGTPGTSARLIIEKPADAKLYVDERLITTENTRNTFATPNLNPFQAYFYVVRVESVRDGKPVSESRRVIVRAGQTVQETFSDPGIATASLKVPAER